MTPKDQLDETVILPNMESSPRQARPAAILVEGSGPALADETNVLLRRRLRLASFLLSAGFCAFLIGRIVEIDRLTTRLHWCALAMHVVVTVVTAAVGWRLSHDRGFTTTRLRALEVIVFTSSASFFMIVSFSVFLDGAEQGYVASAAPMWMTLVFTYALFIPNTWKRAAVIIGCMTAIPIALLMFVRFTTDGLATLISDGSYLQQGVLDNSLVLVLSGLIAIWGVFTINSLRRESFEARQLGHYRLRQRIGAGGMGEVYLAEHLLLKRPCAIKVIRTEQAGDVRALARFEREVRATARLTHWNTVEIFDYGHADDGTFYYVMEYLPGMNLDELVRMNGPLHQDRIVHLLTQVCSALCEAHDQGLVHRDIKPANIFAAERGNVFDVAKLLDFGLVQTISEKTNGTLASDGSITGSPLYMSPEQARGEEPDERSDIYALGAVAWFLTVGRPPFEHDSAMKLVMAHAHEQPLRPSDFNLQVSEEFDALIMKCLEKQPSLRPQSARALQQMLRDSTSSNEWSTSIAEEWWRNHGCPQKKELDEMVMNAEPL